MKFEITGHLSDTTTAWEAVTDTDWMNREAGSGKVLAMDVRPDATGFPEIHGALEGPLGMRLPFVEDRNHWVKEESFFQGRTYSSGPLNESIYEVRMEPRREGGVDGEAEDLRSRDTRWRQIRWWRDRRPRHRQPLEAP